MELSDLRLALRRNWVVVVVSLVGWLAIGVAMGFLPDKMYRTSASLIATPASDGQGNFAQVANFKVPTLVAIIQSRSFNDRVRSSLPSAFANRSVSVHAASQPGTGIILITTEGTSPRAVAARATATAETAASDLGDSLLSLDVLDTAGVPGAPFSPKPFPALVGTGVAGLITGLLLSVAVYRLRQALDSADELRRRLGVPVLGQLPSLRRLPRIGVLDAIRIGGSTFTEAMHGLRTNIELLLLDDSGGRSGGVRSIAVVSWGSGEGKSTVTSALGVSIAATGREVVIVDADLRRPAQHMYLNEPFGEGVADVARVDPHMLVRPTRQAGLYLLPAGIPDRHPSDVVTVNLPRVIAALQDRYGLMLVDTPPLHGVAETPLILGTAEAVLLVVDASSVKLPEIERAVEQLGQGGVRVVGVVLNRVRKRRAGAAYGPYGVAVSRKRVAEAVADGGRAVGRTRAPASEPPHPRRAADRA